jgi:hypothetical protein
MMHTILKNKTLLFSFIAAQSFAAGSAYSAYHRTCQYSNTIYQVLDHYGFKTEEQKQALRYLMKQSGIKKTDILLDQKISSHKEVGELMLELVRQTQEHFSGRTNNQERWDVKTLDWMKDTTLQANVLKALKTVDMVEEIPLSSKRTDIVCILGATNAIMKMRLAYAGGLIAQNKLTADYLVMLAGERYLTPDKNGIYVDGAEQELRQLANVMGKNLSSLTESDLMRNAYETSTLYRSFSDKAILIDTPRHHLSRPTTETTVLELCEWLKKHPTLSSITFISNQPYVLYQKEIIERVFKTQALQNISIEVLGPKFNPEMEMISNRADMINCVLQELGSRIWAATPNVLFSLNVDMSDPQLQANYKEIYKKFPLVYDNAQSLCLSPIKGRRLSFS